jgi:hypothetical protein
MLAAAGCGEEGVTPPSPEAQLAIENVAKWYGKFRQNNASKTPANEEEFLAFVEKDLKQAGITLDRDKLLTSPRDGQKYVVLYGPPITNNSETNPVVHEREGSGGKKLVAFEFGTVREVTDAELQNLLAGK